QFHIEQRTEDYTRRGLPPDEARRAAERRFGSVSLARDRTADVDVFRWLDDLRRDLGYGLRLLWRSPGFTLLAILCLPLGIGANAAVFSSTPARWGRRSASPSPWSWPYCSSPARTSATFCWCERSPGSRR